MNEIELQKEYIKKVAQINKGKDLKYCILTMGCQLNENDSEKLCGMLEDMGYSKTDKFEDSDFAIFNTCCVRENAEDKLFGNLGELKRVKERQKYNYSNWWMYDARKAYYRQNKEKL